MSKVAASKDKAPKNRTIGGQKRLHTAYLWKKKKVEAHKKAMESKDKKK